MYNIYIKQVASMKGVTATREIFEKAIDELPDEQVKYNIERKNFFDFFLKLFEFIQEKYVNAMLIWNVNLVK